MWSPREGITEVGIRDGSCRSTQEDFIAISPLSRAAVTEDLAGNLPLTCPLDNDRAGGTRAVVPTERLASPPPAPPRDPGAAGLATARRARRAGAPAARNGDPTGIAPPRAAALRAVSRRPRSPQQGRCGGDVLRGRAAAGPRARPPAATPRAVAR
ncbi:hypothetical protein GCM10009793_20020 [Brachybacterium phenoliresistens]